MRVIYLSDLHLRDERENNSQRLLSFLRDIPKAGDILILGGDIFDLFIGDKDFFKNKFSAILGSIQRLSEQGCKIYYLEGNHDFHLAGIFEGQKNITICSDDFEISEAGKKIWISHGDWIDEEDKGYRLLRNITRSLPLRILLKILPGSLIGGIGNWSSHKSREYNDVEKISVVKKERTRGLFKKFAQGKIADGADFVLVGHSHLKDQLRLQAGAREGEYINLGFSARVLPYAAWESGQESFAICEYP